MNTAGGCGRCGLAAKLGVGYMTIVRAERGAHVPRPATLQRLAELGGVSVEWLVGGTGV